jgi:hypothetical protein
VVRTSGWHLVGQHKLHTLVFTFYKTTQAPLKSMSREHLLLLKLSKGPFGNRLFASVSFVFVRSCPFSFETEKRVRQCVRFARYLSRCIMRRRTRTGLLALVNQISHCPYSVNYYQSTTMAISLLSDTKENINSLQEPQDQAVSTRKIPRNAKWLSGDDATLLDSLKTFADGNSADNGTFKSAVFTAAAKALKDSHKTSGGALKTLKSCLRRWATVSSIFPPLSC